MVSSAQLPRWMHISETWYTLQALFDMLDIFASWTHKVDLNLFFCTVNIFGKLEKYSSKLLIELKNLTYAETNICTWADVIISITSSFQNLKFGMHMHIEGIPLTSVPIRCQID